MYVDYQFLLNEIDLYTLGEGLIEFFKQTTNVRVGFCTGKLLYSVMKFGFDYNYDITQITFRNNKCLQLSSEQLEHD